MSTSSRVTAKRCVSSFARSRMSPTSRSSRVASASTVSSDASCCSGSSTTPSSSAETWPRIAVSGVRSSCDTDIRKFRSISSTSASRPAISRNRSLRCAELARRLLRHRHVVVPGGDLVGGVGELQHGTHDAPRQVPRENRGDEQADEPREREPLDQVVDALADVGLRRRDDDRADRLFAEVDRVRDRQVHAVRPGRHELERQRLARRPVDRLQRQALEAGDLAREETVTAPDEVDLVAGRLLERCRDRRRRQAVVRLARLVVVPVARRNRLRVERGDAVRLALQPGERLVVREALEEPNGDQRRDHAGEHEPRQEDER